MKCATRKQDMAITIVYPKMVDFNSKQGYRVFATASIARYSEDCKKAKNAALGQKMLFMNGH